MNSITNAKLPIGLVVAVVAQAMGIAFYISQLQADLSVAQQAAEAASIEVAATAKKKGLQTTVFEAEKRIMQRAASKEIANFIKSYHEKMGVELKLNTIVDRYLMGVVTCSFS